MNKRCAISSHRKVQNIAIRTLNIVKISILPDWSIDAAATIWKIISKEIFLPESLSGYAFVMVCLLLYSTFLSCYSPLLCFTILRIDDIGDTSEVDLCVDGFKYVSEPWRAAHRVQTSNSHDLILAGLCWPCSKASSLEQCLNI